jgi:hypothetical protein
MRKGNSLISLYSKGKSICRTFGNEKMKKNRCFEVQKKKQIPKKDLI